MLRVFEAFSGYGSQSIALRNLGIEHEVVAISEIDKYAIKAYEAIHGPTLNLGDISKIDVNDIPQHDLFTYSFPCQDLSVAGKQKGLGEGTRSGLLYECEKVIEHCRPKYLLLENVKNLVGKKFKADFDKWLEYLEGLGYTNYWKVLNAKNYGVPQNRERVFVVSILGEHEPFEFPKPIPLDKCIADILEEQVDDKYYLSEEIQKRFKITNQNKNIIGTTKPDFRTIGQRDLVYNKEGIMGALVATDYKQPKQIAEKPVLIGGIGEKNFGKQYRQGNRVYDSNGIAMCLTSQPVGNAGGNSYLYKVDEINQVGMLDIKGNEQIRRVYGDNGISPTLNTMQGGNRQPKIITEYIQQEVKVRKYEVDIEELKKTLKEAKEKAGITIKEIADTLEVNKTTVEHWFRNDNCFSIPDENIWHSLKELLNITTDKFDKALTEFEIKDNEYDMSNRVYHENGISPTLTATGENGAKKIICEQRSDEGLRFFKDNICGTIRTINSGGDKRVIEYKGEEIELPCIGASRGRNPENPSSRVAGEPTEQRLEINTNGTSNTITTVQKDNYAIEENFRIRKLTPRECFRLMGMRDSDIDKIQEAGISNTQQYKLAGNSIVVDVLEAIFKNLFGEE